ncbi:MAG TPA: hypothetical protein VK658_16495 [Chryseolinea sp.]|nr:hypothetical protein [Chryseolinea sp.]
MEGSDREQQDGLIDAVGDMVETYRRLVNVRIVENAAVGGSLSIVGVLLLVMGVFVLLFSGLGAAWWIGDALQNMKAGFFIVGGFYLFILAILLLTASSVILPWLRNIIVRKIYDEV